MLAAIAAVRVAQPRNIIVAAPVGAAKARARLLVEDGIDEVVFAHEPAVFHAVGSWFQDFSPTPDDEVRQLLMQAAASVGGAGRAAP